MSHFLVKSAETAWSVHVLSDCVVWDDTLVAVRQDYLSLCIAWSACDEVYGSAMTPNQVHAP